MGRPGHGLNEKDYYPNFQKDRHIGMRQLNADGDWMEIVDYQNVQNITVRFDDGTLLPNRRVQEFTLGKIRHPNYLKLKRTGEKNIHATNHMEMEIIEYRSCHDIDVRFSDGKVVTTQYSLFKSGKVPYPKSKK